MVEMCQKEKNLGAVAVCDIWTLNRERAAADCKRRFGSDVKQFKYSEKLLAMPELELREPEPDNRKKTTGTQGFQGRECTRINADVRCLSSTLSVATWRKGNEPLGYGTVEVSDLCLENVSHAWKSLWGEA